MPRQIGIVIFAEYAGHQAGTASQAATTRDPAITGDFATRHRADRIKDAQVRGFVAFRRSHDPG